MTAQSYLRTFLIIFAVAGGLIFMWSRTDLFPWIGPCNSAGYSDDHYLAYCEYGRYGDFEHGALLYNFEPDAVEQIKRAEILFLGNSRTQYTFSSQPVVDALDATGKPWYIMGFGFGARSEIPEDMFNEYQLRPRMLVINADPFFNAEPSGISKKILAGSETTREEYSRKQWLQGVHTALCQDRADSFFATLLCGTSPTLFRSRSDGTWIVDYYRPDRHIAVTYNDYLLDELDATVEAANSFIDKVGVPRECIVLTVLPQRPTPLNFGKALADRLALTFYSPELDDLWTIDASHMDVESNNRWSTAFMRDIAPTLQTCLES
ncbi:MAG: hypothetical protein AAF499_10490 [Pseudomonadota bacterium]